MGKMLGLEKAMENLNKRIRKAAKDADVQIIVGFKAPHAVFVHEDEGMNHPNGGQAKFLEEPATENAPLYGRMVADNMKAGKTLRQALMAPAVALKQDSQALCPVDTGELKGSAFIRVDTGRAAKTAKAAAKTKKGRQGQWR